MRSTEEWLDYFQQNAARQRPIPWQTNGIGADPAELAQIRRSLQAWQLGETSDGAHLAASADRYATWTQYRRAASAKMHRGWQRIGLQRYVWT